VSNYYTKAHPLPEGTRVCRPDPDQDGLYWKGAIISQSKNGTYYLQWDHLDQPSSGYAPSDLLLEGWPIDPDEDERFTRDVQLLTREQRAEFVALFEACDSFPMSPEERATLAPLLHIVGYRATFERQTASW
jgi:hypothetical protein